MTLHHQDDHLTVHIGDCRDVLKTLPAESVHCVVTSPPYWGLRDYGVTGAIGLEPTPEAFIASMVEVFREVRRVLRRDGTLWLNMGDSYSNPPPSGTAGQWNADKHGEGHAKEAIVGQRLIGGLTAASGLPAKNLVGMPWRLAFALQADGWYLRSDIIWAKPNPMPESVTDRPTKSHEYVFLLTKSARYFYDAEAVREAAIYDTAFGFTQHDTVVSGRNLRSVWSIATEPYPGAHFATFPQKLVEPCIKAGTSERGVCPECGAPWVREVEVEYVKSPVHGAGSVIGRHDASGANGWDGSGLPRLNKEVSTIGWRRSCGSSRSCHGGEPQDPIPATVLDPFAGSGTTGLVANRLGRRAILIDLSADYIDQAMLRNQQHPLGLIG